MKKIISGMAFRLFKGIEFWVLIVILLVSTLYSGYNRFTTQDYFSLSRNETNIARRYESSGVSALDAYRMDCEAMSADVYYKISDDVSDTSDEVAFVAELMGAAQIFPVILILLFIPFFFGRMFSDGGIKNLIASGHSKGKIYLSALIMTFILDAFMYVVNLLVYGFWCLYFGWKPPVYLPVVIPAFFVYLLLIMTLSAVSIAILFVTKKKTLCFIGGFLLAISLIFSVTSIAITVVSLSQNINANGDNYKRFRRVRDEEPYEIEQCFDYSEAKVDILYKGEDVSFVEDSVLPPAVKNTCLVFVYLDPLLLRNMLAAIPPSQYLMARDGLFAVNGACNVFWIALSTFCGIIIFKKREIRC